MSAVSPASRFAWEGQSVEYVIHLESGTTLASPTGTPDGIKIRVLGTRPAGDGVDALVAVDVAKPVFY